MKILASILFVCGVVYGQALNTALNPVSDFIATIATATTTATASSGSTSLTVASATGIQTYQAVSGAGIPVGAIVTNVSGTTITISVPTTAPLSTTSVTFGGLPSASASPNKHLLIIDGVSACDVGTGGASTRVMAVSNGSSWTAPNCGGSGSGGGFTCAATNVSANVLLCPAISGFTVPQTLMVTTGALTNSNSITSPTITVNTVVYTIVSNTGQGPRAGQIAPNSATLFLGISGTSAMILNDSIVFDSTFTSAWNSFPWTVSVNWAALYPLANTFTGNDFFTGELGVPNGASLPGTCSTGQIFQDTSSSVSSQLNLCGPTANTWTAQGGSSLKAPVFALWGFGDSYIVGTGATTPATQGVLGIIAQSAPTLQRYNWAVGGTSADAINFYTFQYYNPSPTQPSITIMDGGANDGACLTTACVTSFKELMMSTEAYLSIPFAFRQMASTATATGTWSTDNTVYAPGSIYTASPGNPISASASAATLTFSIPSSASTKVGVTFLVTNSQTGTFTISVDGTLQTDACSSTTTFSSGPCGNSGSLLQRTTSAYRQEFTVTANTTHTVVITTTNSAKVNVTCVDWIPPSSTAAMSAVFVIGPNGIFTGSSTLNPASLAVANQLKADGLPVFFVDQINGTPGVNTTTDLATSATATCDASTSANHPNSQCGYFHLAQTLYNVELTSGWVFQTAPPPAGPINQGTTLVDYRSNLPGLCNNGQIAGYSAGATGQKIYLCVAGNWELQGGSSLPDAFGTNVGHWEPFGTANGGSPGSTSANTLYGVELPPSPLATFNAVGSAWTGTAHIVMTLWNAAGTTALQSSSVVNNPGGFMSFSFSGFQLQANTTYIVTWTSDASNGPYFAATASATQMNQGTIPRMFTCATAATWSGGVPTLPGSCPAGTRSAYNTGVPIVEFFHQ